MIALSVVLFSMAIASAALSLIVLIVPPRRDPPDSEHCPHHPFHNGNR